MDSRLFRQVAELEDAVRFHNKLSADEFAKMDYETVFFQGKYILKQQHKKEKQKLKIATFTAWQIIRIQLDKPISWKEYSKKLGISDDDEIKPNKEDLKLEAEAALSKVNRIIAKAKAKQRN